MAVRPFNLLACVLAVVLAVSSAPSVAQSYPAIPLRPAPTPQETFPFGVAWYPEQFPESEWNAELDLMRAANISFVRIAEFSWSTLEPSERRYEFAWLDRAIAAAAAKGMKVVIGTPTAAPPAWMTAKYPDILLVEADGKPATHGWRRHGSVASPRYRKFAAAIAGKLAERYGRNPAVIAWQIDNEYGRETWDAEMERRFQLWLQKRYRTIDALNDAWGNRYWSLDYSAWNQIKAPRNQTRAQPALWIDWLRFGSSMWSEFQQNQIDAMRPHLAPDVSITTNYVAKYAEFDWSVPARGLDFVSWDWYFDEPAMIPADGAMQHDVYRGFLKRNVWVMETAPGVANSVGPGAAAITPWFQRKGETRSMAWQAVAHGADGYAWWVWRSPRNGVETPHGAVVDADMTPMPIYADVAKIGGELAKVWPRLRGSTPVADVAMLHDFESRWAIERQPLNKDYDPWKLATRYRAALMPVSKGVDVQAGIAGLERYPLVVAPNLFLIDPDEADTLLSYVRAGGHLVVGPRGGVKTRQSNLTRGGQFGVLADALGVRIDMSRALSAPVALVGSVGKGDATIWAERLTPNGPDVETLLSYGKADGWLDDSPAVVSRKVGRGRITYVGAWLDETLLARVIAWSASHAGVTPHWSGVPADVEVAARKGGQGTTYVAINWGDTAKTVVLPRPMTDLLSGADIRSVPLGRFGVAVLGDKE